MANERESPFACDMTALTKEQRERHHALLTVLKAELQEVREMEDGFTFRFPSKAELIRNLGEFIAYERLCCPFFDLEVLIEREAGPAWLRLGGRTGIKDFIRLEFGL